MNMHISQTLKISCLTHSFIWRLESVSASIPVIFLIIQLYQFICPWIIYDFPPFLSIQYVSQQDTSYLYLTINPLPPFQPPDLFPLPVVSEPTSRILIPVSLFRYLKRSDDCRAGYYKLISYPYAKTLRHGICNRGIIIWNTMFMGEQSTFSILVKKSLCCMLTLILSTFLSLSLCMI